MRKFFDKLLKYFKILLLVVVIAIVIKAFAFDAFQIPSASMENTLLPGDYIIANKFAYEFSTPHEFPIFGFPIPYTNIFEVSKPKINDVIVFQFPRGFANDSLRGNSKYVKRIIAGPHDTLIISNDDIYINGEILSLPETFKTSEVKERGGWINDPRIYPSNSNWNKDNYGPIVIPGKGDTIKITPENFEQWQSVIVMDFGERALIPEGTVITLAGKAISEYVLTQDHYFVIGDNFDNSLDSRYFGFITDKMIIGKALFIYWSYDSNKTAPGPLGFLSAIRANRIFNFID